MPQDTVGPAVRTWLHDPKTWVAMVVVAFGLGGTLSVYSHARDDHQGIMTDTNARLRDHVAATVTVEERARQSSEQSLAMLQEIVRVSRANCINNAKDAGGRQACL